MRPNFCQHSQPRNTRIIVLAKKDPNNKIKARILLPLALMPPLLRKIKTKIRTRKIWPILSAIIVSRKVIMPTNISKKSQKTSVSLDNLHDDD